MQTLSPLMVRSAIAKSLGFVFGIAAFVATREMMPDAPPLMAWGVLALYVTIGGVVGITGQIEEVPLFGLPFPVWARGAVMGAWLTLLVILFSAPILVEAVQSLTFLPQVLQSPWWMIVDGAIAGAIIDVIVTFWVGNGLSWRQPA